MSPLSRIRQGPSNAILVYRRTPARSRAVLTSLTALVSEHSLEVGRGKDALDDLAVKQQRAPILVLAGFFERRPNGQSLVGGSHGVARGHAAQFVAVVLGRADIDVAGAEA